MIELPSNKPIATGAAGAVATIVLWVLSEWAGISPPPEVATAGSILLALIVFYLVPTGERVPSSAKEALRRQGWRPPQYGQPLAGRTTDRT